MIELVIKGIKILSITNEIEYYIAHWLESYRLIVAATTNDE